MFIFLPCALPLNDLSTSAIMMLLRRADLIFPLQRVVDAVATPMVLDAGTPRSICVSWSVLVVLVLMWTRAAMWPFFRSSALTSGFFDTCAMQCNAMDD